MSNPFLSQQSTSKNMFGIFNTQQQRGKTQQQTLSLLGESNKKQCQSLNTKINIFGSSGRPNLFQKSSDDSKKQSNAFSSLFGKATQSNIFNNKPNQQLNLFTNLSDKSNSQYHKTEMSKPNIFGNEPKLNLSKPLFGQTDTGIFGNKKQPQSTENLSSHDQIKIVSFGTKHQNKLFQSASNEARLKKQQNVQNSETLPFDFKAGGSAQTKGDFSFGKLLSPQQAKSNPSLVGKQGKNKDKQNLKQFGKPKLTIQLSPEKNESTRQFKQSENIKSQVIDNKIRDIFAQINIVKKQSIKETNKKKQVYSFQDFNEDSHTNHLAKMKAKQDKQNQILQKEQKFKMMLQQGQISPANYRKTIEQTQQQKKLRLDKQVEDIKYEIQRFKDQKLILREQIEKYTKQALQEVQVEVKPSELLKVEELRSPKFRDYGNFNLLGNNKQLIEQDKKFKQQINQQKQLFRELQQRKKIRQNLRREVQNFVINQKGQDRWKNQIGAVQQRQLIELSQKYDKYYRMYRKIKDQLKSREGVRQISKGMSDIYCMNSEIQQRM